MRRSLVAGVTVAVCGVVGLGQPSGQPADTSSLVPGVTVWAFDLGESLSRRPTLAEGQTPNVYFNTPLVDLKDGVGEGSARLTDMFCGEVRGWLTITEPGVYNFMLTCDDGAAMFIDDGSQPVADTETPGGPEKFMQEGAVTLTPGLHKLRIPFYEDRGGFKLQLKWRPPGTHGWQAVPVTALRTEPGQTFAVSPGPKRWFYGNDPNRPGDGRPLEGVHPSMALENFRGPDYRPPVGAMCFLPDGRLAVATWDPAGAVDILSNLDGKEPGGVVVKRFASGLGEPLGMAYVDGDLLVTQKQEITRLRDMDGGGGDGVADRYEAVASGWPASHNYHEFSFNLVPFNGSLYFTTSVPLKSGVTMYLPAGTPSAPEDPTSSAFAVPDGPGSAWKADPKTGELTVIGRGLRAPNGMNIGFDGQLFCADNQGAWLPSSKLNHIRLDKPAFYGHQRRPDGKVAAVPPVVWFPQGEIGNSPSEPVLIPDGPYRGQMLIGDVTYGGIQRVFVEKVGGQYQGCVFRFTQGLEAGVNRLAWGPDGCLYVGGVGSNGNWNHNNTKFGLQRLRPRWDERAFEMERIESRADGLLITFTEPVGESVITDPTHYQVSTFRYRPTVDYGGPKIDLTKLAVRKAAASPDRTRVFLDIPGLAAGSIAYVRLRDLKSESGEEAWSTEAWYTLNAISSVAGPGFDAPVRRETLPVSPPAGATVLFGGHTLDRFSRLDGSPPHWMVNAAGELVVNLAGGGINEGDLITREGFGDCFVHVEWLSPAGGDIGKQTNGNSGVKLQSRYEIQVMNSPGCGLWGEGGAGGTDAPKFNEAGAIYRQSPPMFNASYGPGVWQTYDMRFKAPKWKDGKKTDNARITLWWNGVLVHDNAEIKDKTGMSVAEAPGEHPLLLQSHPSEAMGPVRYRNIWIVRE
jgi:hypothetical protein